MGKFHGGFALRALPFSLLFSDFFRGTVDCLFKNRVRLAVSNQVEKSVARFLALIGKVLNKKEGLVAFKRTLQAKTLS